MPAPRLLLFGTPGAGKTSLLEARAEAAATADATVTECSGSDASQMLQSKTPFAESAALNAPILNADAVLLIVDASLSAKQLGEEFQQFRRWLVQFHEARGKRTLIGALPVYVVLTKCDLLAKPSDSVSQWMERIEEAKRRVDQKFHEYLDAQGTGFGTLQLRVWAAAIKRPALADRPAKAMEPYGVTELFRQCLQSALDYQERRGVSQGRVQNMFIALSGVIAILALSVGILAEFQPGARHTSLDEKVASVLPKKDESRLRYSVSTLEKKRDLLNEICTDPEFEKLPTDTQKAISQYRDELGQYLQLYTEEKTKLKQPHLAKNEEEYNELKKNLDTFPLTEAQSKAWENTALVKRLKQIRKEFNQVEAGMKEEESWFRAEIKTNDELLKKGNQIYLKLLNGQKLAPQEAELWNLAYREQMQPKSRKPREEMVPGTRMTYEDLEKFQRYQKAQEAWVRSKSELKRMSDNILDRLK